MNSLWLVHGEVIGKVGCYFRWAAFGQTHVLLDMEVTPLGARNFWNLFCIDEFVIALDSKTTLHVYSHGVWTLKELS